MSAGRLEKSEIAAKTMIIESKKVVNEIGKCIDYEYSTFLSYIFDIIY
jgi:hypothetical protein